jgi:hypothetical protein
MTLDWRNHTDVAIIIPAASIAVVISGTVITSGAIIAIGSVIRVPTVDSVVIFIFQFPVGEELEVLAIGQGLMVL